MIAELETQTIEDSKPGAKFAAVMPAHVKNNLVGGTSALGLGLVIERGCGFLANVLAARLGGASHFGAYSLAISTANNISAYAAGGIGSTAIRFSGKYQRETAGYATLSRVLIIISVSSAILAALGLWLGAAPIAHLLGDSGLTTLLRWAALSAAGMILLECCRGFLVGQRKLGAILLLSVTVGIALLALLPLTSRLGSVQMITSQGAITVGAVLLCLLFYRPLGLAPTTKPSAASATEPVGPMLKTVWSFGLMQLAGLIGINAAGWWLTSLVARADTSMVQMGFFAVSSQLRNMVALAPGLLAESSLAVMAQGEDRYEQSPDQVMALCTLATTFGSLLLAGTAMILVPWGLLLYGKTYTAASSAAALAMATAVIHMGSAPASARLTIVSIKASGMINTLWAVLVAASATIFLFHGGNAWKATFICLAAHALSAGLVFFNLRQNVPADMLKTYVLGAAAGVGMAALAFLRSQRPELTAILTASMTALCVSSLAVLLSIGRKNHWVPSLAFFQGLLRTRLLGGANA